MGVSPSWAQPEHPDILLQRLLLLLLLQPWPPWPASPSWRSLPPSSLPPPCSSPAFTILPCWHTRPSCFGTGKNQPSLRSRLCSTSPLPPPPPPPPPQTRLSPLPRLRGRKEAQEGRQPTHLQTHRLHQSPLPPTPSFPTKASYPPCHRRS